MKLIQLSKQEQITWFLATIIFRQETFYGELRNPSLKESRVYTAIGIINGMRSMFLTILEAYGMEDTFWKTKDASIYIKKTDIFFTACTELLRNLDGKYQN